MTADILARWAHLYSDNKTVSVTVTYVHLAAVLVAGGLAAAADREALIASPSPSPDLAAVHPPHRLIVIALLVIGLSGILMTLSDVHHFLTSAVFWTKMGLILLLLGNGALRLKAEHAVRLGIAAGWSRLRRTSIASLVLWFVILLAGTIIGAS